MTDSTIAVAEPGTPTKLLQSYQNTISSQTVQAEGVVQVDLNGVPVPRGTISDAIFHKIVDTGGTNVATVDSVGRLSIGLRGAGVLATFAAIGPAQPSNTAQRLAVSIPQTDTLNVAVTGTPTVSMNAIDTATGLSSPLSAQTVGLVETLTVTGVVGDNQTAFLKLPTLPARANATAPAWTEGNTVPLSTDLAGNLRVAQQGTMPVSLTSIPNPSNLPLLSTDQLGNLQTNNDNDRRIQERLLMLAELAAVNSLISNDNGSGANNYQELR